MNSSQSPMASFLKKKPTTVITPTRKSFLSKIAEDVKPEPQKEEPVISNDPHEDDPPREEEKEDVDDFYSRMSPIRKQEHDIIIPSAPPRPQTPPAPKPVEEEIEVPVVQTHVKREKPVETITREHISPTRDSGPSIDLEDEDDIMERVTELISDSGKIDYNMEPKEVRDACLETFKSKFQTLKINYPKQGIEFPEGKSLNKIHDKYHAIYKSIYVNANLGQLQLGYIIILMAIEVVCIKAFNIPMSGFAKMESKRLHRYNQLMVELGENLYSTGGGSWPLEWRILGSVLMNIAVFIAIKFLAKYLGGDSKGNMEESIRSMVDGILDNPITKEDIESGKTSKPAGTGPMGGLGDMMSGGGFADILASFGTDFTKNMEKKKSTAPKQKKKRFIFED